MKNYVNQKNCCCSNYFCLPSACINYYITQVIVSESKINIIIPFTNIKKTASNKMQNFKNTIVNFQFQTNKKQRYLEILYELITLKRKSINTHKNSRDSIELSQQSMSIIKVQ